MQDELPSPEAHVFPMNVAPPRADVDILFMADFRIGDAGAAQSARWLAALLNSDYVVGVMECLGAAPAEPLALDPSYVELRAHPRFRQVAFDAHVKADLVLACDLRLFGPPDADLSPSRVPKAVGCCDPVFCGQHKKRSAGFAPCSGRDGWDTVTRPGSAQHAGYAGTCGASGGPNK